MLEVTTFARAADFLAEAQTFLESNDAANGLIGGAALEACARSSWLPDPRRWLLVHADGARVMAAVALPDGRLASGPANAPEHARAFGAWCSARFSRKIAGPELCWQIVGPRETAEVFALGWLGRPAPMPSLRQILLTFSLLNKHYVTNPKFRKARPADVPLLRKWMREFDVEVGAIASQPPAEAWITPAITRGDAYVYEDAKGIPIATASVGARTRLGGRIHLVYVDKSARRCAAASSCVASMAGVFANEGLCEATLFAGADATAALALYTGLGFKPVAEFVELALE